VARLITPDIHLLGRNMSDLKSSSREKYGRQHDAQLVEEALNTKQGQGPRKRRRSCR
ncbi:unnamed protein product, partial [Amoebophrya sp. A25]